MRNGTKDDDKAGGGNSNTRTDLPMARPGVARRVAPPPIPPVPPPRPASTLSPWTRDIVRSPEPTPTPSSRSKKTTTTTTASSIIPTTAAAKSSIEPLPSSVISLSSPRPGEDRSQNVYVDAPLPTSQHRRANHNHHVHHHHDHALPHQSSSSVIKSHKSNSNSRYFVDDDDTNDAVVKKRLSENVTSLVAPSSPLPPSDSIICRDCGRCRCDACRTPARLPSTWLCGGSCRLSAESVVDTVTCMCAVRACLYHVGKDTLEESDESKNTLDTPASCAPDRKLGRWACLTAASLCLPCLCCYLPLKGCVKLVEKAYQAANRVGCTCNNNNPSNNNNRDRAVVITEEPITAKKDSEMKRLFIS